MMTKTIFWLALAAFIAPAAAQAQVIEIDDMGESRTFDRPTVFADILPKGSGSALQNDHNI